MVQKFTCHPSHPYGINRKQYIKIKKKFFGWMQQLDGNSGVKRKHTGEEKNKNNDKDILVAGFREYLIN